MSIIVSIGVCQYWIKSRVLNSYSKLFRLLGSLLVNTVEMRVIGVPGERWSQVSF